MNLGRFSVAFVLAACGLAAQDFTGLTCTAKVDAPRDIDANTATGLIGDTIVECTGGTPTPAGQPVPHMTFELHTTPQLPFTSRTVSLADLLPYLESEALLFINDPAPDKQRLCLPASRVARYRCPSSDIGSGNSRRTYDPDSDPNAPRRGNAWLGYSIQSGVQFQEIPFDPPGTGNTITIRTANVLVNVAPMGVRSGEQKQIDVELKMLFEQGAQQQYEFHLARAANVRRSVNFTIQNPVTLFQCEAANPGLTATSDLVEQVKILTAIFQEEFGSAYRSNIKLVTPNGANEFHGPAYLFTGYSRARREPEWPVDTGFPDSGTELTIQLDNVPTGVDLFAERVLTNGTARAELVTGNPSSGRFQSIFVTNGRADMVWRVTNADYDRIDSFQPGIAIVYPANRPALGITSIKGFTGPINAYPARTIPRYFGSYPEDRAKAGIAAFSINDCAFRDTVRPRYAVTTGFLPITYFQQGNLADLGKFYALSDGSARTLRVEGVSAPWLRALPNSDRTPVSIDILIDPDPPASNQRAAALAPGSYNGTFRIVMDGAPTATITVPLTVNPPGPHLTRWGVANTASYEAEAVAPGEALTFFGERFGPDALVTAQLVDGKFATTLGETRVLFDGVAGSMIYAARGQVSAIAPFGLAGKTGTRIQIEYRGVRSPAVSVPVAAAVPGLLTADASGSGKAAALNQDNSFNSQIGALPGEFVVFFGVGGPPTDVPGRDGELYAAPLPKFTGPITVLLDGLEVPAADIAYIGPAPGLVQGVWQANVRIPANASRNSQLQIQFRFGEYVTQPGVTVSVR